MPLMFNDLVPLSEVDISSLMLVRHHTSRHGPGRTPFHLWRTDKAAFLLYQRIQVKDIFKHANWLATFVVTPSGDTLFVGLYRKLSVGSAPPDTIEPLSYWNVPAYPDALFYDLQDSNVMAEYIGRLSIDWGKGALKWVQHATRNAKPVVQIAKEYKEEPFPGLLKLLLPLSSVHEMPETWKERLSEAQGVYLLTCPRTHEHYVGSASGTGGFLDRWLQHAAMQGDAVKFRSRDPEDYQVSILEVVGSGASRADIISSEHLWMRKLQSTSMGLNGSVQSATNKMDGEK